MKKIGAVLLMLSLFIFSCSKDDEVQDQKKTIDLFILAGQSNALGRQGDASGYPADPNALDSLIKFNWTNIEISNSDGWTTMGPQTGFFPNGHFGPEVTFGRNLVNAGYKPAIFKYTRGATSIFEHWRGPGEGGYYDDMVADLNIAINELKTQGYTVKIKAFIWIQGESDSNSDAAANAYADNLNDIINDIRSVTNNSSLPIILGVDEQYFDLEGHQQPAILNAHQALALSDDKIKFTSMYGYPKADITHLTPAGLIQHGKGIFDTYQVLVSGNKPSSNCTLSSGGDVISVLTKKAWGQSFSTDCSGFLSSITFSAASDLDNSATFTLHNGAECSGDIIFTQTIDAITTGDNTISIPGDLYLEKEHTYYMSISSDTDTGWKVNYSNTDNVIGNLRTSRNDDNDVGCKWSFLDFDLNFSVEVRE